LSFDSDLMNAAPVYYLPLLCLLGWAAALDVRARRVPNWLTLSLAGSGLALSFTALGAISPRAATTGLLFGLALGVVLFTLGAWGAGDAKLLAGMGAWLGLKPALIVLATALVFGMLFALVQSLRAGRMRVLLRDTAVLGLELARGLRTGSALASAAEAPPLESSQLKQRTLPLAVPLLLATAGALVVEELGR
jgi:prepilin peptidase CpaA